MQLSFEKLAKEHDRAGFECGVPELDCYLKNQAGQDMRRNLSSVFVLLKDDKDIVGYYTLSQNAVATQELPENVAKKLPSQRPISCTLLGRLAVDARHQGQGLGRVLLFHALKKAAAISGEIAAFAVVVDAKDLQAKKFYEKYNFLEMQHAPLRLFIPINGILKMLELWER
ncbi:MAG: GNAT family N-acetyltransferase [Acidobacteriota bacterium]|nr:GNAT family N-acetyltransferase [Acidobacteriota bacterium]